ncbi:general secretion pathway protein XpsN [Silanimonas algicola]
MLDALRPATWLCGAVAAWSLGLLLLAIAGLGGRVGPHPADPSLGPPIPELRLSESAQRLGAATDYLAVGERPLFNPDRRPASVAIVSDEQQAPFNGVLTSVLITDALRLAIFSEENGQVSKRVRLGDTLPGTAWRLASLEPRRAVLEGPEGQRVLDLRVFDGQGGAAPTPVSVITEDKPDRPGIPAGAGQPGASNPPNLLQQASQASAESQRSAADQAQIDAIRARIDARRAQLAEQQAKNNNAPVAEQ